MTKLILPNDNAAKGVLAFIAVERDGMIQVIDMWPMLSPDAQRDTTTVTNAPQVVLTELKKRGFPITERPVIYLDEKDRWDIIKVTKQGDFDNFCMIQAKTWQEALKVLLEAGYIDRRDLLRAPIVSRKDSIRTEF